MQGTQHHVSPLIPRCLDGRLFFVHLLDSSHVCSLYNTQGFLLYLVGRVGKKTSPLYLDRSRICGFHFCLALGIWHVVFFLKSGTLLPLVFERYHSKLHNLSGSVTTNIKLAVVTGWIQRLAVLLWVQACMTKTQSLENSCHRHNIYPVCIILASILIVAITKQW